jgi:hypothetical protein
MHTQQAFAIDPLAFEVGAPGQLRTMREVKLFALAGKATLTIRSKQSGTRFTFKIAQPKRRPGDTRKPIWFVSLLSGASNESDYRYLGQVYADGRYVHGQKSPVSPDAPSARAFAWFWQAVQHPDGEQALSLIEVWHEGCCGRCGRKLTVPESIASGFGPECANHIH